MITTEVLSWLATAPKLDLDALILKIKAREKQLNSTSSTWFHLGDRVKCEARRAKTQEGYGLYMPRNTIINGTYQRMLKTNALIRVGYDYYIIKPIYLSHDHSPVTETPVVSLATQARASYEDEVDEEEEEYFDD